jgi:small multidrug resistance pump
MYLLLTAAAAALFAAGGVLMKLSDGLARPLPAILVYVCFGAAATLQARAMRTAELGAAYLLVLGLEAVLAFLFGACFFREGVSALRLTGVAAVVVGIVLLHAGEP